MRGYLRQLATKGGLICLLTGSAHSLAQKSNFNKTTSGIEERRKMNGLSEEEIQALQTLDADTSKQINEFKQGRESSGINGKGRFSNTLEMHDDLAGTTYHTGPSNGLESKLDKVATKGKNGSEAERQKALKENTGNAPNCENGFMKGVPGNVPCMNLSPVLVDKGPAHGDNILSNGDVNTHRAYELTKEAKDASIEAGKDYGAQAIADANFKQLNQEAQNASAAVGVTRSIEQRDDGVVVTTITKDGKSERIEQNADIDLLRSEYSWLEQQKKDYAKKAWKTLRAARLAGIETQNYSSKDEITEFNSLVSNSMDDPNQDEKLAERIAERGVLSGEQFCIDPSSPIPIPATKNPTTSLFECPPVSATNMENKIRGMGGSLQPNEVDSLMVKAGYKKTAGVWGPTSTGKPNSIPLADLKKAVNTTQIEGLYNQARQVAQQNPDYNNQIQTEVDKIIPCLERDKWCYGPTKVTTGVNSINAYDQVKAGDDPGAAFDDTREYVYSRYELALESPLADQKRIMQNMDFGPDADANSGTTVWADYEKEWQKSMDAYNEFADATQKYQQEAEAYGAYGKVKLKPTNPNDRSTWNANTMTQMELFGRDPTRDATSIAGTGQGNKGYNGSIGFNPNNLRNPAANKQPQQNSSRPNPQQQPNEAPPLPLNQQMQMN